MEKIGDTEDFFYKQFPKESCNTVVSISQAQIALGHASTLEKLQINSAGEPDKDSPHHAKLSTG